MIDEELSEAVVAFAGSPGRLNPIGPEERVQALLGDRALDLVPRIRAIQTDLYAPTLSLWNAPDLAEMGRRVERWLRENHPELSDQAVAALRNRYAYDYK